jgi:DNA-binding transcriptional LysR family regulator
MEFRALRYFFEAARSGSIRQAAERLHVAASAVSRQIAHLEHEFGAPLIERRSQGIRLTPAGQLLARHLETTYRDLTHVRSLIDEFRGLRRGELAIHCIEGIVYSFLPAAIGRFNERFPDISFTVVVASTDNIVEALRSDKADIGITLNAPRRPELRVVEKFAQPLQVLAHRDHSVAGRRSITLAELSLYQVAVPDVTFGVRQLIDRGMKRANVSIKSLVTTNSIAMTRSIVRTGRAITLLPQFAMADDLETRPVVAIPISDKEMGAATLEISVRKGRELSFAAKEFLEALKAATAELRLDPTRATGSGRHSSRTASQG